MVNIVCLMKNVHKKYFFGNTGNKAVCLLRHETIAISKKYYLKHHETKHSEFDCKLSKEERKLKATECVKMLKKQQAFTKQSTLPICATDASFMITYNLVKRNKPFTECEFIKDHLSSDDEVTRFQDFRLNFLKFNLLSYPIIAAIDIHLRRYSLNLRSVYEEICWEKCSLYLDLQMFEQSFLLEDQFDFT